MINGITKWFKTLRLKSIAKRIIEAENHETVVRDFIDWTELALVYLDEDKLDKSRRVDVRFLNLSELSSALDIWGHNLINTTVLDYRRAEYSLLLDDWLVDDESYRLTIKEFLIRNRDRLRIIKKGLDNCNSSGLSYHLSCSYDILLTLREIVGICHESEYRVSSK